MLRSLKVLPSACRLSTLSSHLFPTIRTKMTDKNSSTTTPTKRTVTSESNAREKETTTTKSSVKVKESKEKKEYKAPLYAQDKSLLLHTDLQAKLQQYREKRAFDAEAWTKKKCEIFNAYMKKYGLTACALNLSGGIDSAVTLGLMKYASKMKDSPLKRLICVAQPIYSSDWALQRATEIAKCVDVPMISVDQTKVHDDLCTLVDKSIGVSGGQFAKGQMRSYQRTPVIYYVAQLLGQEGTPCVVMGTGNKDEDGYLGYFCKAGDGVVDIQLISDLHKSEVYAVGGFLQLPKSVLTAAPSADLWPGHTDEGELGFSYDFIELFVGQYLPLSETEKKAFLDSLSSEARTQFEKWGTSATKVHARNAHKFSGPINLTIL
eukprot:TRINITY_DN3358_c0_g1_i1.p1 TRINITY_DN3358_c0_g1~~TRINITY_DN3358_c0_g1_i1.p1  ORF type:complete len:377 (+),score=79.93 TRINITY_DN3358_c0_g1_i1:35-1165(+)